MLYPPIVAGKLGIARGVLELLSLLVRNQVLHRLVCFFDNFLHSAHFFSHNVTNLVLRSKYFHQLVDVPIAQHIASIISLMWIECATRTRDPLKAVNRCGSCLAGRPWLLSRWGSQACVPSGARGLWRSRRAAAYRI